MAGWLKRVDGSGLQSLETSVKAQENKPFLDIVKNEDKAEEGNTDKLKCLFNDFLSVFHKEISGSSSVRDIAPMLGNGQSVDVFKLYLVVREKGGYEKVSQKGLWNSVAEECGYHAIFGSALKLIHAKYLGALNACFQRIAENKGSDSSEGCIDTIRQDIFGGCTMDVESMKHFFSEAICEKKNVGGGYVKLGSRMSELDIGNELRLSGIDQQSDDVKLNGEGPLKAASHREGIRNLHTEGLASANNNDLLRFHGNMEGSGNGVSVGKNVPNMLHRAGIKSVDVDQKASTNADSLAVSATSDLKRKRECASAILNWLSMVAKNPCNPIIGTLPESSKWKFYTSSHIWKQIMMVRESMMLKKNVDSNEQKLNWQKKQKMHPMMYDDHTIYENRRSEKQRYSQRILYAKECPKKNIQKSSSSSVIRIDSDSDDLETYFPDLSADPYSIINVPRQSKVLIGRHYQAEVSDWVGKGSYEPDLKWEGVRMWPSGKSTSLIEREPMGRGRHGSCGCSVPGSIECVKFHVTEKRTRLRLELGTVYYHWRFDSMGEDASFPWLKTEEKMFYETVKKNPFYLGCFWNEIRKSLPKLGKKSLVNFYFNVFNLRRRGDQNRLTPGDINSDDDDEPNDGSEMVVQHGSKFCSPKKSKVKSK